jgi:hypothetical protein
MYCIPNAAKIQPQYGSFHWRIVPYAPMSPQLRQSPRRHYYHLNSVVAPVALLVGGMITEDIAVAQIDSDLLGDVGKFDRIGGI